MNKRLLVVGAMAAMMLVACGGGAEESKPASNGGNTPTSSQASKPASSSKSSTSKAPVKSMTVANVNIEAKDGKAYVVISGTAKNYAEGEFKWAWGFEHVTKVDGAEGFAYGSATPTDADYKEVVTVAADGSYSAKFCITDTAALTAGLYKVYAGAKGYYGNYAPEAATIGGEKVKDTKFKCYYRYDEECDSVTAIALDALPPIALEEAIVYAEEDQTWVKIGGQTTITLEEAQTYTPFVQFQQVGGRWTNTKLSGDSIKWDFSTAGKAYICANISFFAAGTNYNTHLNMKENQQADCKMDVDIDQTYVVNGKQIQVTSNTAGTEQADFWGNLGFRVTNPPAAE